MAITLSIKADVRGLERKLDSIARKQLPYAISLALTAMAKGAAAGETAALGEVFDNPTPFTKKAMGVIAARKATLTATLFVRDRQAKYFSPYEFSGHQVLNSRALLNPKNIRLNQYGNLPKGTLARLKARPDIYIGPINTHNGVVNGVWQRVAAGHTSRKRGHLIPRHLKLLIRFGDGVEVNKHLDYHTRAIRLIRASSRVELNIAIARALATAKKS